MSFAFYYSFEFARIASLITVSHSKKTDFNRLLPQVDCANYDPLTHFPKQTVPYIYRYLNLSVTFPRITADGQRAPRCWDTMGKGL